LLKTSVIKLVKTFFLSSVDRASRYNRVKKTQLDEQFMLSI